MSDSDERVTAITPMEWMASPPDTSRWQPSTAISIPVHGPVDAVYRRILLALEDGPIDLTEMHARLPGVSGHRLKEARAMGFKLGTITAVRGVCRPWQYKLSDNLR